MRQQCRAVRARHAAFPNTLNLPTIAITDRVVNLSGQGGYQYAKLSLAVEFADTKAQFTKANGA
ncbi:MAG: flagellar basal body-associated FliL family protein, partial [Chloroflexota bacterium]